MLKKTFLPLILGFLAPFLLQAEWIPINKQNTSPAPPNVTLISDDNNSTVLKIEISGFELKDFISGGKTLSKDRFIVRIIYNRSRLSGIALYRKSTWLFLIRPVFQWKYWKQERYNHLTTFICLLQEKAGSKDHLKLHTPKILMHIIPLSAYPGEFAQLEQPSVFRDFRITRVSVFPFRYIPAKKELQVVSSITVRINYGTGEVVNPKTSTKKPIAPSFGELYQSLIFNYQSVLDKSYGGKEEGHELMLCIMPDEFYASFQTYAEWKRQSGIDIHITKFSDIGANCNQS